MYIQVNKRTAEKLINKGYTIRMIPCKLRLGNIWFAPAEIDAMKLADWGINFTMFVNEYIYYNCNNNEVGRHPHYFLYGDFTMGGEQGIHGYKDAVRIYEEAKAEAKRFAENW